MATNRQRFLVIYKSNDPAVAEPITFGVYAKKYNQAISTVRAFIYAKELHKSKVCEYTLNAEPSNKPANHEIPDDDGDGIAVVVADDRYNIVE